MKNKTIKNVRRLLKEENRLEELQKFDTAVTKYQKLLKDNNGRIGRQEMPYELRLKYVSNISKTETAGYVSKRQKIRNFEEAGIRKKEGAQRNARL